ncbi:cation-translocating P-type ATPase [Celeribacter indicus]|uniref:P-type ATPase, translocating n=1 Tax=Celeribacter indicus TaxID=1208324 RepID=A0A0B5DWU0_9RHOB|nr:cation-transporting P-type ATPase [Celeribacter indicus]AJE45186.1 P-type ATPase, translocating [Celeribacter indicus]SDX59336.1 Ca2+-transporting ATPase [Celeribacter indicus]
MIDDSNCLKWREARSLVEKRDQNKGVDRMEQSSNLMLSDAPHGLPSDEVARLLAVSSETGLSQAEAARRLKSHGPNRLRRQKPRSALAILLHQFRSVIVWLLAAAAAVSLVMGDHAEAAAIAIVLVLNSAIGFFTELRAARSMEALFEIAEVRTRVRRDGHIRMIDARDLVPGDVVVLEGGDMVTADLRLTEASYLEADESVLTGEAAPVAKTPDPVDEQTLLAERTPMLFKGTAITQGAGTAIVTATGMATELGRISSLAETAQAEISPLEVRLEKLGHMLLWLTLILAVGTAMAGILRGHALADMVQTGVALAVAAIPEGLPVVATLSLARGMWRMARRNALIRRLSAVETLGATTLILTDKTGTLTENRMTVVRFLLEDGEFPPDAEDRTVRLALKTGALCTTAELGHGREDGTGDPMELALLRAADGVGLPPPENRLAQHAFKPERRMMATVHADPDGAYFAVKGAPETIINACGKVLGPAGPHDLTEADRAEWMDRNARVAGEGLRTLGLAMKIGQDAGAEPYEGLTLIGLVCFADPLRSDIPPAIAACREAGVRVAMITGDHAATAARIASEAGIGDDGSTVIEGHELAELDPEEAPETFRERLRAAEVFARVAPEAKLTLVDFHQQDGQIVAMTGDGVNDAPALKKADIGVAMGLRGTQVAREAADMVLSDDDFATIVEAIRQGRVIFGNIRKFIVYLMSCNLCEVLVVAVALSAGLPAPLLPLQILYLNLVTDVFPAFALGLGQGDGREMHRPPRPPSEPIVGRTEWLRIAGLGAAQTVATLAAFMLALYRLDLSAEQAVTVAFLTLALAQLWNVFNTRAADAPLIANDVVRNPYVWGALALCLVLIGAALWVPELSSVLSLATPGTGGLALAAVASLLPLLLGQAALAIAVTLRPRSTKRRPAAAAR